MALRLVSDADYKAFLEYKRANEVKQAPEPAAQPRATRQRAIITYPTKKTDLTKKRVLQTQEQEIKQMANKFDPQRVDTMAPLIREKQIFQDLTNYFNYTKTATKRIAKQLVQPTNQSVQIFGTMIGVFISGGRRDDPRKMEYYEVEKNPIFPYHGPEPIRFQIAQMLSVILSSNGYVDATFFVPPGYEYKGRSLEELDDFAYHRRTADNNKTKFQMTVFNVPYSQITRGGEVDERKLPKRGNQYLSLRLKDGKAPNICYIAENQVWNMSDCECVIDYLVSKKKVPRNLIIEDLDELKIKYDDGISVQDFEALLQKMHLGYYLLGPDFRLLSKYPSDQNKKIDIVCLINNNHVYPIENADLVQMCKRKEVNDQIFKFDLKTVDFKSETEKPVIVESKNLDTLAYDFFAQGLMPSLMSFRGSSISALHHENKVYMANENYSLVLESCKLFGIEFENQTLPKLCFQICESFHKMPTECTFTHDSWARFGMGQLLPVSYYFEDSTEVTLSQIDISRFYTSILYGRSADWCLIDKFCDWVSGSPTQIHPGFYRVYRKVVLGQGYIVVGEYKIIDHALLTYLVEQGYMDLSDVCEFVLAKRVIKPEFFRGMVEHFYKNYPDSKILKQLFNNFIGYLAIQERKTSNGFLTSSKDTAETFAKCYSGHVYQLEGQAQTQPLYKVVTQTHTDKTKNYRPLWNQVINQSYIELDKMINALMKPGRKIYAIKTDCLLISGLDEVYAKKPTKATLQTIGKYYHEGDLTPEHYQPRRTHGDLIYLYRHRRETQEKQPQEIPELLTRGQGFILNGRAGTGKSYTVNNVIIPKLRELKQTFKILTPTHMAGNNYECYQTLSSYFTQEKPIKYNWLLIDEYSMVGKYYFSRLHDLKTQGTKIILVGDLNQALPIEQVPLDYSDSMCLKEMTDFNLIGLTKVQRYDMQLYEAAERLLLDGLCQIQTVKAIVADALHVCYTNAKVKELNDAFKALKAPADLIPMMCLSNTPDYSNGQLVYFDPVKKIYLDYTTQEQLKQPTKENFVLAYAVTCHKVQGQTFHKSVQIHEAAKMDKHLLYTAITRVKSFSQVTIYGTVRQHYADYEFKHLAENAVKTETGAIYKLLDGADVIYVGCVQDAKRIAKRMEEHKLSGKKFTSYTSEPFVYYSTRQLFNRETEEINKELDKGSKLVNCLKVDTMRAIREQREKFKKALQFVPLEPFKLAENVLLGYIVKTEDRVYFKVQQKKIKEWRVGRRTLEDTLKLATEFQKEFSKLTL